MNREGDGKGDNDMITVRYLKPAIGTLLFWALCGTGPGAIFASRTLDLE